MNLMVGPLKETTGELSHRQRSIEGDIVKIREGVARLEERVKYLRAERIEAGAWEEELVAVREEVIELQRKGAKVRADEVTEVRERLEELEAEVLEGGGRKRPWPKPPSGEE
jgi:chromosome segregation ATPase